MRKSEQKWWGCQLVMEITIMMVLREHVDEEFLHDFDRTFAQSNYVHSNVEILKILSKL